MDDYLLNLSSCINKVVRMQRWVWFIALCVMLGACGSKEDRRDGFFNNALSLESSGRMAEARVQARNVVKLDPNHVGAYLLLARCALHDQNWRDAFGNYQRAVELERDNVEALLGTGRLYLLSGETAKAEEAAAKILQKDPESLDGKLLQAGAILRSGRLDQAADLLTAILHSNPESEDALVAMSVVHAESGRLEEALKVVEAGLVADPSSRALLFRAAGLAADAGQFTVAEERLRKLIDLDPDNAGLRLLLVALYDRQGDKAKVENLLAELLASDPASEDARLRLVDFLMRQGRAQEALELIRQTPDGPTPKLRLAMSGVHMAKGEGEEALALLTALADDAGAGPLALEARLRLAELLLRRGDQAGAMLQVDLVLARNPGDFKAHAFRGQLLMMAGRFEEAVGEFRVAANESPDDQALAILLARAQFAQGNTLLGLESLRAFLGRSPQSVPVRMELAALHERQGQAEDALKVLREGLVGENPPVELELAMGDIEARRQRLDAARDHFLRASEIERIRPPALLRLARLEALRQNWDEARTRFAEFAQAYPDDMGGAEGMVAVEFAAGRSAEAVTWAQQRAALRPDDALAADLLGRALLRAGRTAEAEEAWREAQRRAPEWTTPSTRLAQLLAGSDRADEAIAEARSALAKNPGAVAEALLLGQLLQHAGQEDEAETIYRGLLQKHPQIKPAANNLAYLLANRPQVSPDMLREALDLATMAASSNDPMAVDTLGWVHYRLGDLQTAQDYLRQAHEVLPEDPAVTYHLAQVLADQGHTAEARELLARIMEQGGSFYERPAAKALLDRL